VMLLNEGNQWAFWRVTLTCGDCAVVLAEDPNGRWGSNNAVWMGSSRGARSADIGNWADYWLGRAFSSRGVSSAPGTNVTMVYDDVECVAQQLAIPPLNMTYCELSVSTSAMRFARSYWGSEYVEFQMDDGTWRRGRRWSSR